MPKIAHGAPYLYILRNNLMFVANKKLIHPVLCAWSKMVGDHLFVYTDETVFPHASYLLPRRIGSDIYPINEMAADACEGVKKLLMRFDLWPEVFCNAVRGRPSPFCITAGSDPKSVNESKIRAALRGQVVIKEKPVGTELLIHSAEFVAKAELVQREYPDVPNMEDQYFAPHGPGYNASVYMQGKGEFFYVFHRGSPGTMEVHKLCCLPNEDVEEGLPLVFKISPLKVTLSGFGSYYTVSALYSKMDSDLLLVFLALERPAQDRGSKNPPLHLFRCQKVPAFVQDIIDSKKFSDSHVRRSDPHWIVQGLWSQDNWLWTAKKGWWEPIPRSGRY